MEKEERRELDYDLIYKIEEQYGSLALCPEEDENLQQLREILGVPRQLDKYDKETVEELRKENGLTAEEVGLAIGYKGGWYRNFRASSGFYDIQAEKLAELFGVDVDYLLR